MTLMSKTLILTGVLVIDDRKFTERYYKFRRLRGSPRYSLEIKLAPGDTVIWDGDSLPDLQAKAGVRVSMSLLARQHNKNLSLNSTPPKKTWNQH